MVYLIHFETPYKHAGHYLGTCRDGKLLKRLRRHDAGDGARLMQVVKEAGIGWWVVRVWPEKGREFERHLKHGSGKRHCPICSHRGEIFNTRGKELRKFTYNGSRGNTRC